MPMDFNLLQKHTVEIYHLLDHHYDLIRVKARQLLKPQRFDLFAKLFYIENRQLNQDVALMVYEAHIKAFNPNGKEPGRQDKNGIADFVMDFNYMIDHFKDYDFDETRSIVPVDRNGVILDGAHRVSALAFYDKEITIAYFKDVETKCDFDYMYFINRGLSWDLCDMIAFEMSKWCTNMLVACLWPKLGSSTFKTHALNQISKSHRITYCKKLNVNQESLTHFVKMIYQSQPWTNNPLAVQDKAIRIYGNGNHCIWFVFFVADSLIEKIQEEKEQLRALYGLAKDSVHMTDNTQETQQIAFLTLTKDGLSQWNNESSRFRAIGIMAEKWHYFKKVTWVSLKVRVYKVFTIKLSWK